METSLHPYYAIGQRLKPRCLQLVVLEQACQGDTWANQSFNSSQQEVQ